MTFYSRDDFQDFDAYVPPGYDGPEQNEGLLGDIGTGLQIGIGGALKMGAGLIDLAAEGGHSMEDTIARDNGREPPDHGRTATQWLRDQGLDDWLFRKRLEYTPEQWASDREVEAAGENYDSEVAKGLAKVGAYITHPRSALRLATESAAPMAASMIPGVGVARGVGAGVGLTRGIMAASEGLASAGGVANAIIEDNIDNGRKPTEGIQWAIPAGVGVALTAGVMNRFGGGIETAIANKTARESLKGTGIKGLGKTIAGEGTEEGLQAPWETIPQNIATDKPWEEGLGSNVAESTVAGGLMGGGMHLAAARPKFSKGEQTDLLDGNKAPEQPVAETPTPTEFQPPQPNVAQAAAQVPPIGSGPVTDAEADAYLDEAGFVDTPAQAQTEAASPATPQPPEAKPETNAPVPAPQPQQAPQAAEPAQQAVQTAIPAKPAFSERDYRAKTFGLRNLGKKIPKQNIKSLGDLFSRRPELEEIFDAFVKADNTVGSHVSDTKIIDILKDLDAVSSSREEAISALAQKVEKGKNASLKESEVPEADLSAVAYELLTNPNADILSFVQGRRQARNATKVQQSTQEAEADNNQAKQEAKAKQVKAQARQAERKEELRKILANAEAEEARTKAINAASRIDETPAVRKDKPVDAVAPSASEPQTASAIPQPQKAEASVEAKSAIPTTAPAVNSVPKVAAPEKPAAPENKASAAPVKAKPVAAGGMPALKAARERARSWHKNYRELQRTRTVPEKRIEEWTQEYNKRHGTTFTAEDLFGARKEKAKPVAKQETKTQGGLTLEGARHRVKEMGDKLRAQGQDVDYFTEDDILRQLNATYKTDYTMGQLFPERMRRTSNKPADVPRTNALSTALKDALGTKAAPKEEAKAAPKQEAVPAKEEPKQVAEETKAEAKKEEAKPVAEEVKVAPKQEAKVEAKEETKPTKVEAKEEAKPEPVPVPAEPAKQPAAAEPAKAPVAQKPVAKVKKPVVKNKLARAHIYIPEWDADGKETGTDLGKDKTWNEKQANAINEAITRVRENGGKKLPKSVVDEIAKSNGTNTNGWGNLFIDPSLNQALKHRARATNKARLKDAGVLDAEAKQKAASDQRVSNAANKFMEQVKSGEVAGIGELGAKAAERAIQKAASEVEPEEFGKLATALVKSVMDSKVAKGRKQTILSAVGSVAEDLPESARNEIRQVLEKALPKEVAEDVEGTAEEAGITEFMADNGNVSSASDSGIAADEDYENQASGYDSSYDARNEDGLTISKRESATAANVAYGQSGEQAANGIKKAVIDEAQKRGLIGKVRASDGESRDEAVISAIRDALEENPEAKEAFEERFAELIRNTPDEVFGVETDAKTGRKYLSSGMDSDSINEFYASVFEVGSAFGLTEFFDALNARTEGLSKMQSKALDSELKRSGRTSEEEVAAAESEDEALSVDFFIRKPAEESTSEEAGQEDAGEAATRAYRTRFVDGKTEIVSFPSKEDLSGYLNANPRIKQFARLHNLQLVTYDEKSGAQGIMFTANKLKFAKEKDLGCLFRADIQEAVEKAIAALESVGFTTTQLKNTPLFDGLVTINAKVPSPLDKPSVQAYESTPNVESKWYSLAKGTESAKVQRLDQPIVVFGRTDAGLPKPGQKGYRLNSDPIHDVVHEFGHVFDELLNFEPSALLRALGHFDDDIAKEIKRLLDFSKKGTGELEDFLGYANWCIDNQSEATAYEELFAELFSYYAISPKFRRMVKNDYPGINRFLKAVINASQNTTELPVSGRNNANRPLVLRISGAAGQERVLRAVRRMEQIHSESSPNAKSGVDQRDSRVRRSVDNGNGHGRTTGESTSEGLLEQEVPNAGVALGRSEHPDGNRQANGESEGQNESILRGDQLHADNMGMQSVAGQASEKGRKGPRNASDVVSGSGTARVSERSKVREHNGQQADVSMGGRLESQQEVRSTTSGSVRQGSPEHRLPAGLSPQAAQVSIRERVMKHTPAPMRPFVGKLMDIGKRVFPYGYGAMFTKDLVDLAKKVLPEMGTVFSTMEKSSAYRNDWQSQVADIHERFQRLDAKTQDAVNELLEKATLSGVWFYDSKAPELDGNYEEYVANLSDAQRSAHTMLKGLYSALPEEAQEVVRDVFDHGSAALDERTGIIKSNIRSIYDDQIAKAATQAAKDLLREECKARLDEIDRATKQLKGPYVALKRFGKYQVVVRSKALQDKAAFAKKVYERIMARTNGHPARGQMMPYEKIRAELLELMENSDDYIVESFDTQAQADAAAEAYRKEFKDASVESFERTRWMSSRVPAWQQLEQVVLTARTEMEAESGVKDQQVLQSLYKAATHMYVAALKEQSARKSELKRRKVRGFNRNMMDNFLEQGRSEAVYFSNLKYGTELREGIREMTEAVRHKGAQRGEASKLQNEMLDRINLMLNGNDSKVASGIMRTTSIWMLMTNPAFYLQNLTQPFMMSAPMMAGRYGSKAFSELGKNAINVTKWLSQGGGITSLQNMKGIDKDLYEAIDRARDQGHIDIGITQDFGHIAASNRSKFSKTAIKVTDWLTDIARKVEIVNRVSTFITAYNLAKGEGKSKEEAYQYADNVIYETHGDYSAQNAPRYFRMNDFAKVATQFRKFQLIQIGYMFRLVKNSFAGATPEERAVARASLKWTMGVHLAAAGIKGTPLGAALMGIVAMALGDDGEDGEEYLRRVIGDKALADVLLNGLPAGAGVDLSQKIGASNMLGVLPYYTYNASDGRQAWYEFVGNAMGPAGSLGAKAADAGKYLSVGDYWKGLEQLLPTGFANVAKATRFGMEGITTRAGDVVVPGEEFTLGELIAQGIGVTTMKVSDRNRLMGNLIRHEDDFDAQADRIRQNYRKAVKAKDVRARREAMDEWREMNAARKNLGFRPIALSQLIKSASDQRKRERRAIGGVASDRSNQGYLKAQSER